MSAEDFERRRISALPLLLAAVDLSRSRSCCSPAALRGILRHLRDRAGARGHRPLQGVPQATARPGVAVEGDGLRRRAARRLQNEPERLVPRADLVRRLAAAGARRIEAVSFVHPERVPQMAGARRSLRGRVDAELSGLVLNRQGYRRSPRPRSIASMSCLWRPRASTSGTATPSLADATTRAENILRAADRPATATISCGSGFEGEVDAAFASTVAERLAEAGAEEVVLAEDHRRREENCAFGRKFVFEDLSAATSTTCGNTGVANAWSALNCRVRPCSTPPSGASAAARSRRTPPAASPTKTCSTCSTARASRRASTSTP